MVLRSRVGRFVVGAVAGAFGLAGASAPRAAAQRPASSASALPSEEQLIERERMLASPPQGRYWPEIEAKLKQQDYSTAEKLATTAINAKGGEENPQLAAYVRSLAFLHRAEARRHLGAVSEQVNRDVAAAARLGNLVAIRTLVAQYVESAEPEKPSTARVPPGVAIGDIFEVGLDLGSAYTLRAVANGFGPATPAQRALSGLLYALQSRDESLLDRVDDLARQTDLARLLSDTAFVGGPFPSRSPASPPRDVLATLFAENALRQALARGLGFALPERQQTRALSLREVMELNSWHGEMSGMATVYHLVAEDTDFHQHAFTASRPELLNELRPGDAVHVRCGALAHTAVVWAVDRSRDELLLTDPLFQFWRPSHNACIETFKLVHFKYGFYFTQLKLSEVLPLIDAIQTVRSFETPLFMARIGGSADQSHAIREIADKTSTRCAGGPPLETGLVGQPAQAGGSEELIPTFPLRKRTSQAVPGSTLTTTLYLPVAVQFMGDAAVATRADPTGCVRSMSLFLRRSFVLGAERIEASKLFSTFMDQVFRPREVQAWAVEADTGRGVRETQSPLDRIVAVLSGARQSVSLQGNRLSAYVAGVRSEAGAEWIRIDAW